MKKEEIKGLLYDYLSRTNYGPSHPKKPFICRNPHRPEKTGSMFYHETRDKATNKTNYYCHCFGCGVNYNIFDFVILDYGIGLNKPESEETEQEQEQRLKDPKNLAPAIKKLSDIFGFPYLDKDPEDYTPEEKEQLKQFEIDKAQREEEAKERELQAEKETEAALNTFYYAMEPVQSEGNLSYLHARGFTDEIIKMFCFKEFSKYPERIYYPYQVKGEFKELSHVVYRDRGVSKANEEALSKQGRPRFRHYKRVSYLNIFDPFNYLYVNQERVIFITEAELDAISIYQCLSDLKHEGKEFPLRAGAIASGGASKQKDILKVIDKLTDKEKLYFCIIPDNDETGKKTALTLGNDLSNENIKYCIFDLSTLKENVKDVNDLLQVNRELLKENILNIINNIKVFCELQKVDIEHEAEEMKKESRKAFIKENSLLSVMDKAFYMLNNPQEQIKTNFSVLDDEKHLNGGLDEGIITLAAGTSIGKTTLLTQLTDQMAQNGQPVLYVSLEASKYELMLKSFSRNMFLLYGYTLTPSQIKKGDYMARKDIKGPIENSEAKFYQSIEYYKAYARNLYFIDYEDIIADPVLKIRGLTVEDIENRAKDIKENLGKAPVIIIDYLQLLEAPQGCGNLTDKQITDKNIKALSVLSHYLHIPIICISSINRGGYYGDITLESLKESGLIEFHSYTVLGLNVELTEAQKEEIQNIKQSHSKEPKKFLPEKEKENEIKLFYETKVYNQEIRKLRLDVLKHRGGKMKSNVHFEFFTNNMFFLESEDQSKKPGYYRNLLTEAPKKAAFENEDEINENEIPF